jgi:hypothetical protein
MWKVGSRNKLFGQPSTFHSLDLRFTLLMIRSSLFSHKKIEIIHIDDSSEGQTKEHYCIAGRMEDDTHDHWH